eukprot:scaffold11413_cov79-Isochrysis_galbana.AAC.2
MAALVPFDFDLNSTECDPVDAIDGDANWPGESLPRLCRWSEPLLCHHSLHRLQYVQLQSRPVSVVALPTTATADPRRLLDRRRAAAASPRLDPPLTACSQLSGRHLRRHHLLGAPVPAGLPLHHRHLSLHLRLAPCRTAVRGSRGPPHTPPDVDAPAPVSSMPTPRPFPVAVSARHGWPGCTAVVPAAPPSWRPPRPRFCTG